MLTENVMKYKLILNYIINKLKIVDTFYLTW